MQRALAASIFYAEKRPKASSVCCAPSLSSVGVVRDDALSTGTKVPDGSEGAGIVCGARYPNCGRKCRRRYGILAPCRDPCISVVGRITRVVDCRRRLLLDDVVPIVLTPSDQVRPGFTEDPGHAHVGDVVRPAEGVEVRERALRGDGRAPFPWVRGLG